MLKIEKVATNFFANSSRVSYDDKPLGYTQLLLSANEIIGNNSNISIASATTTPEEIKALRRKAKFLELLYEMSKTLGTVFDLKETFLKATDLIFRGTPAERVVALLARRRFVRRNFELQTCSDCRQSARKSLERFDRKINRQPDDKPKKLCEKKSHCSRRTRARMSSFAARNQSSYKASGQRFALL